MRKNNQIAGANWVKVRNLGRYIQVKKYCRKTVQTRRQWTEKRFTFLLLQNEVESNQVEFKSQ